MLERQPGDVKDLLLRTALLDRVNGELADLLTGRPGSERILLELEDANAFVVSLDLAQHGHVVDAIRHTQAAGDWPGAARLLADHSFSLTLDGQAQTIQALLRAFPAGAGADPELALVRAGNDLVQGHLDEAAAHLAVAETYAGTAPPDRQRRLRVAIAALKLSLARRRGHLADVLEQVEPVPAGDRQRAVRLAEHRQHAHPQHLRQARCPGPLLGRAACAGTAAASGRPYALARTAGPGCRR